MEAAVHALRDPTDASSSPIRCTNRVTVTKTLAEFRRTHEVRRDNVCERGAHGGHDRVHWTAPAPLVPLFPFSPPCMLNHTHTPHRRRRA